jgi:hypothetical protein
VASQEGLSSIELVMLSFILGKQLLLGVKEDFGSFLGVL